MIIGASFLICATVKFQLKGRDFMNWNMLVQSLHAFHINGMNSLIFNFTSNWCLILLVAATVISVVLGVKEESVSVIREEQNIL